MFDDYIKKLSEEDKIIFIEAFMAVISCDGKISAEEKRFMFDVAKIYGIGKTQFAEILKNFNLELFFAKVPKLNDRKIRLQLIREMLILMSADNEVVDKEVDVILKTAEFLGIEDERVRALNIWVNDQKIWVMKGRYLLETE